MRLDEAPLLLLVKEKIGTITMSLNGFQRMVDALRSIATRPGMYIDPVTPEMLSCYIWALRHGVTIWDESLSFDKILTANFAAHSSRNWELRPFHTFTTMREKGMSEEEIIQEMIAIEIELWKILEKNSETR